MKTPTALLCLALAACALPSAADAARAPRTAAQDNALWIVTHDPPRDAAHPARNRQLLIDSHGAKMKALSSSPPARGRIRPCSCCTACPATSATWTSPRPSAAPAGTC
jgi:hypothetical protein